MPALAVFFPTFEATVPIQCKGRNKARKEVLDSPVCVKVEIRTWEDGKTIGLSAACPHVRGGHGEKCNASGEVDVHCAYAIDLPYAMDVAKFG